MRCVEVEDVIVEFFVEFVFDDVIVVLGVVVFLVVVCVVL